MHETGGSLGYSILSFISLMNVSRQYELLWRSPKEVGAQTAIPRTRYQAGILQETDWGILTFTAEEGSTGKHIYFYAFVQFFYSFLLDVVLCACICCVVFRHGISRERLVASVHCNAFVVWCAFWFQRRTCLSNRHLLLLVRGVLFGPFSSFSFLKLFLVLSFDVSRLLPFVCM